MGKARRSALAIFGLGNLAKGFQEGMDKRDEFNQKLALLRIAQEEKTKEEAYKRQQDTLDNRFKAFNMMRGYSYTDPQTGRSITIPGTKQTEIEKQFPDVLLPTETAAGAQRGGLIPSPAGRTAANPANLKSTLDTVENLLHSVPTNMSTSLTALTSKALGGQRGGLGSNDIKNYEDFKPAASTQLYRALTGDTRLSDADAAARAMPLLPSVYPNVDTQEVRAQKIQLLRNAVGVAEQKRALNPGQEIDLGEIVAEAQKRTGGQNTLPEERIRVRSKQTGTTGTIPKQNFDPTRYEVLQ